MIEGNDFEKTLEVLTPKITIGREKADFKLNDTKVSSMHACIEIQGQNVILIDTQSSNGTTVNNHPIHQTNLKNLDIIGVGYSKIQINMMDHLETFIRRNTEEASPPDDISSMIDDELVLFSKWDLPTPFVDKKTQPHTPIPYGLIVKKGPDKGKQLVFEKWTNVLGRGDVDCCFLDSDVSRKHALIKIDSQTHHVQLLDSKSTNGTFVNGQAITSAHIQPGDIIRIGQTLFIIFKL